MQPVIYIYGTPEFVADGSVKNYRAALERAGAQVVHSSAPEDAMVCDGLLLPGGGDVDSGYYGQESRGSLPPDSLRDTVELWLIRDFLAAGKPILGICRGAQMLNVALGGSLLQDIPGHSRLEEADRLHPVRVIAGSQMAALYGAGEIMINSSHHQVVDRVGDGLRAVMHSTEDYVECIEHETLPVIGVQWHPERLAGELARPEAVNGQLVIDWFVAQCTAVAR